MKKNFLFTPGPTPIPTDALLSMARPVDYHRSDEATEMIDECAQNLKHVFQTENDVIILTSSGTGAMESAVANLLSPKDKVIAIESGKFGRRWYEICDAYGLDVDLIRLDWGQAVPPELVAERLEKQPDTKVVFATLCETSTGCLHDINSLGQITKETETLLVVDAISGLGADELRMDEWNVDAVVSCTQKGLMTPPGLGFISMSEKAWAAADESTLPKYYFDLKKARKRIKIGSTPYTPAITLIGALSESLKLICEEGIENVWKRHDKLARATRAGIKAIGLELFAESPANTVTSVRFPEQVNSDDFIKQMRDKHGVTFAGGQAHLAGKIIRIAHLGWSCEYDVVTALSALEMGLTEMGYVVPIGAGVTAAEKVIGESIVD